MVAQIVGAFQLYKKKVIKGNTGKNHHGTVGKLSSDNSFFWAQKPVDLCNF